MMHNIYSLNHFNKGKNMCQSVEVEARSENVWYNIVSDMLLLSIGVLSLMGLIAHIWNTHFHDTVMIMMSSSYTIMERGGNAPLSISYPSEYHRVLAMRESGGKWDIVGGYNNSYIGLYQFGDNALKDIGYDIRVSQFKNGNKDVFPIEEQHRALNKLMDKNRHYMRAYMHHIGTMKDGILITEAGILAGAHLVGHRGMKKWLDGKGDSVDGFGTKVSSYVKMMENVKL
jgi:hypothetical protein